MHGFVFRPRSTRGGYGHYGHGNGYDSGYSNHGHGGYKSGKKYYSDGGNKKVYGISGTPGKEHTYKTWGKEWEDGVAKVNMQLLNIFFLLL